MKGKLNFYPEYIPVGSWSETFGLNSFPHLKIFGKAFLLSREDDEKELILKGLCENAYNGLPSPMLDQRGLQVEKYGSYCTFNGLQKDLKAE